MTDPNELARIVTRQMLDRGRIVEAGWVGLKTLAYAGAPPAQLEELRNVFFAGALHLYSSLMSGLDELAEETHDDMERMAKLQAELDTFEAIFRARHGILREP